MEKDSTIPVGRFAPSPTGRMHLGNVFSALISWLSVKSRGGRWILRIEDLDPQRSKREYAEMIEDDLRWLGLPWDEGGLDNTGPSAPYSQSCRHSLYAGALAALERSRLTYPCYCRRADLMATSAPHRSDGRIVYAGTCRPAPGKTVTPPADGRPPALRIMVPDRDMAFDDLVYGMQRVNLAADCGDFVLRRGDGAWAYQLAVVVDDALMGVTEVVRGNDLMLSAAQQIYLHGLLGYKAPAYGHLPLVCNTSGVRLSKRDSSLSMQALRSRFTPEGLIGHIAFMAGIRPDPSPVSAAELAGSFMLADIKPVDSIIVPDV